jgi:hypothetical protein
MWRATLVSVAVIGVAGLDVAEAGDKKLPKALSLVQRQAEAVPLNASLRDEGLPEAMSLVRRQADVVPISASLRDEGVPEPMSLVRRQAEQEAHFTHSVAREE